MTPGHETILYKKSLFVTHLPADYRYTRSHYWATELDGSRWRLGATSFAARLLGEIVDYNFETATLASVQPGQVLGWVEGFKSVADVICLGRGVFAGGNPALRTDTELITRSPFADGWLYEIIGKLDIESLDVHEYVNHLNTTIDRLLEKQSADEQGSRSGEPV